MLEKFAAWCGVVLYLRRTISSVRWQRLDEVGGQREAFFVDAIGKHRGLLIGVLHHFEFRIDVVDVMECDGFGRARQGRRAELILAVMGGDEVEEMEAEGT